MVVDFIAGGNHPFSTANEPHFHKLLSKGYPKLKIIHRKRVSIKIKKSAEKIKQKKKEDFKKIKYIALTLDLWSIYRK